MVNITFKEILRRDAAKELEARAYSREQDRLTSEFLRKQDSLGFEFDTQLDRLMYRLVTRFYAHYVPR
jgi:hypothetical protein